MCLGKERLEEFLLILEKSENYEAALRAALFLKESWSSINSRQLYCEINRIFPTKQMRYDGTMSDEEFVWQLKNTVAQSFSVFVEILSPPPLSLLDTLEKLTQSHSIDLENLSGETVSLRLERNVKVFSFVERDLIESQGCYGQFYSMFGSVLSL